MQQLFSSVSCDVISSDNYNAVAALTDVDPIDPTTVGINFTQKDINDNTMMQMSENVGINDYWQDTISTVAASMFPLINYKNAEHLDTTYLKQVGVCVFRAYTDSSNSGKISY